MSLLCLNLGICVCIEFVALLNSALVKNAKYLQVLSEGMNEITKKEI